MNSNVVVLNGLTECAPARTPERLEALATMYGPVWLVRFVPVLRGALIIYADPAHAATAATALHGLALEDGTLLRAALSERAPVTQDEVAGFSLVPPRRLVQLVSPPPSPPDWWDGWNDVEGPPKPAPELWVREQSARHSLGIRACDVYEAVAAQRGEGAAVEPDNGRVRPPRLTIEAPPGAVVPEGFVLRN